MLHAYKQERVVDGNLSNQKIIKSMQQKETFKHLKITSSVDYVQLTWIGQYNCGTT